MSKDQYRRVVLKLSGEAFGGGAVGVDPDVVQAVARQMVEGRGKQLGRVDAIADAGRCEPGQRHELCKPGRIAGQERHAYRPIEKLPDDALARRQYDGIFTNQRFVHLGVGRGENAYGYKLLKRAQRTVDGRAGEDW